MKHIRITLAALLALGGTAAIASAQQQPPVQGHAKHGQMGRRAMGPGGPGKHLRGALLRGITLSDAEKANLKTVREKYAAQNKTLREQFKPQAQAMRDARQRGDTAALKALWERGAAQREATKQLMQTERVDLRAALSAENQTKFDANLALIEKRLAQRPDSAKKRFGRRPPI